MVIDPFSMILLPVMINIFTAPLDVKVLLKRLKNREKPINHDLQKAIKIAYLQALLEITQEFKAGRIESFRLYLPTELDQKIEYWKTELKQVENAKDETEISSPLQDTAEIEQLLLSHGQPIGDRRQELETRLISQTLEGITDIPADYHNQIQTNLFSRIYAHFVEQLKINDRAYRAFELEYLPAINASLTEIGIGQEQVALTMTDMLSVVNRTDQNVQKIIEILNPKSLTLEDWQEICRQNLPQQKQLTTNPFSNANGVTPQLDEIYVPLAIVESKPPKLPSRNQPEEKEEEKLIPIAEECFFEDVLRQGKSQISQGRKIAIIGEPGSGKTTRLQKIADWILKQDLGLPIWISLADLTQPTIPQHIEEIWLKQTGKSLTIDELTQQKERIWLLLDGLDEMTSRVETRHVSALLGGWVQAARVVVTCRVNVWEADKNAFSGFDVFRNLEFNPEQVTDYICRWFAGMGDAATGESLEAALAQSENSRLKELIQNPLRLRMLCQEVLRLQPEDVVDPEKWQVVIREVKRKSFPDIDVLRNRINLSHLDCHNLPPQPNPFIGRQDDLCKLMRLLSADHPANIIQVDGIAGVGKTALVLEAAYCCLEYKLYGETQNPIIQNWNSSCKIPQFDLIIFVSAKESELLNGNSVTRLMVSRTLQEIYRTIAHILDDPIIINMDINNKNNDYVSIIKKSLKNKGNVLLIVDNLETIKVSWLSHLSEMSMIKGDYSTAVNTMSRRGRTLLLMGKPEQLRDAEKLLLKAWDLRQYASFEDLDYLLNHLAGLFNRLERYEDAHKWLDIEQENLYKNINLSEREKSKYQIYIDRERAELLFMQGKYNESKLLCEAVIKNTDGIENGLRNANYARRILADIAINDNQLERAEELLQIVYEEVKANNDKRRIAYCKISLAKLEKAKNQLPKAVEYIQKALNNFEYLGMMRDYAQALSLHKEIREQRNE
ncbi:NACHT domain-containing protein [Planktothrix serta]|nr:NACHT domain-containing protein [Planktothrix serta]